MLIYEPLIPPKKIHFIGPVIQIMNYFCSDFFFCLMFSPTNFYRNIYLPFKMINSKPISILINFFWILHLFPPQHFKIRSRTVYGYIFLLKLVLFACLFCCMPCAPLDVAHNSLLHCN